MAAPRSRGGGSFNAWLRGVPPITLRLIVATAAATLLCVVARNFGLPEVLEGFLLQPWQVIPGLRVWKILSYLFVQGPPGAGKTYTSAHVIVELIRRGKKVGISANSHKVIHNLLQMIERRAIEAGVAFSGVKKSSGGRPETVYSGDFVRSEEKIDNMNLNASLLAGTAWLFADERLDRCPQGCATVLVRSFIREIRVIRGWSLPAT
jgi:hypothetical protein